MGKFSARDEVKKSANRGDNEHTEFTCTIDRSGGKVSVLRKTAKFMGPYSFRTLGLGGRGDRKLEG